MERFSGQNAMTSPAEIQMSSQGVSGSGSASSLHSYSFISSKSNIATSGSSRGYAHSTQGTQGRQADRPTNIKKILQIPSMVTCQLLLVLHFGLFCTDFVPNMYIISGIYITVVGINPRKISQKVQILTENSNENSNKWSH